MKVMFVRTSARSQAAGQRREQRLARRRRLGAQPDPAREPERTCVAHPDSVRVSTDACAKPIEAV